MSRNAKTGKSLALSMHLEIIRSADCLSCGMFW